MNAASFRKLWLYFHSVGLIFSCYLGHIPELEIQMESTNESIQIETIEEVFHAVDDSVKKESSILDEIFMAESVESTVILDGDTNSGGQQQKEVI